jgi:hypothetical protein
MDLSLIFCFSFLCRICSIIFLKTITTGDKLWIWYSYSSPLTRKCSLRVHGPQVSSTSVQGFHSSCTGDIFRINISAIFSA